MISTCRALGFYLILKMENLHTMDIRYPFCRHVKVYRTILPLSCNASSHYILQQNALTVAGNHRKYVDGLMSVTEMVVGND